MSKLLSVVLVLGEKVDYAFLGWQDWDDVELLVTGKEDLIKNFEATVGKSLKEVSYNVVEKDDKSPENKLLKEVKGSYFIVINQKEAWDKDFLSQVKDFIKENNHELVSNILYILGFVRTKNDVAFAVEVMPELSKENKIYKNYDKPTFLVPYVKYIWETEVVKEYNLTFSDLAENTSLKNMLFAVDYFAVIFQTNNYTEPDFRSVVASFIVPFRVGDQQQFLDKYQEHIQQKSEIWEKNIWQRIYWKSKFTKRS